MSLTKTLIHMFRESAGTNTLDVPGKAARARELNASISRVWQDQAIYSKAAFTANVVPLYNALLEQLKHYQTCEEAEQSLIDLLNTTAKACRHRWSVRLPMKRSGSDYRKYEIIYTEALVSAMAVGCLAAHTRGQSPEQVALNILPKETMTRLQADPIVWEDWLGYFQKAERGGLYAVSICATSIEPATRLVSPKPCTPKPPSKVLPKVLPKAPPTGSGRAMLEAIQKALASGSLSFNQPGDAVQVDHEGRTFLEHPKILKWCSQQLALDEDLKKLKSRFSRLKVLKRSEQGRQLYYGQLGKHDRRRIGFVLENPTVLWPENAPTGRFCIETVTARPPDT